ncbi:MAG: DF family (seleno)protein [Acidobacteriota bacterium]
MAALQRPPISVLIAHTEGCGHTPATRELVERVAAELSLPIELKMTLVRTDEEARRYQLHGSPTVLVNGQDVDPAMRGRTDYGFT